jgi:PKD repeat protein
MRKILVGSLIIVLLFCDCIIGAGSNQQTSKVMREVIVKVGQTMQEATIMVPEDRLEYDVNLDWALELQKKSLVTEKSPAYLLIESVNSRNGKKERYYRNASGSLIIPKGSQYRMTICAGEYRRFSFSSGAKVQLKATYPEALIKYNQTKQPYTFDFEVIGSDQITVWKWLWDKRNSSTGKNVTHSFSSPGLKTVIIEAVYNKAKLRRLFFEMTVAPVLTINPMAGPLQGPCNLTVKGAIGTAVFNYGQTPSYSWDFGDGSKMDGPMVAHTYTKPGKYNLVLETTIAEKNIFQNWLVDVGPTSIKANGLVTPLSGPVPLEVTATAAPVIQGGPTDLQYYWEVDGLKYSGKNIKHTFREPGDYQVILSTCDKLHADVIIPSEVFTVKAGPPQITPRLEVSAFKGMIPLTVNFNPNCQIQGSPVNLKYRWVFGDGTFSVLERPSHIYREPGEYLVRLYVSDTLHTGNMIVSETKITALAPQMTVAAAANITKGTVPLNVNFSSQINIKGEPCDPVYIWNFGDGAADVAQNPVHDYINEGVHLVTLEVKDRLHPGNVVNTTLQIETRLPKLRLTAQVTPVNAGGPLQVNCQAQGEREGRANPKFKYTWEFGDGQSAVGAQTSHVYTVPGVYEVIATIWDEELNIRERKKMKVAVK